MIGLCQAHPERVVRGGLPALLGSVRAPADLGVAGDAAGEGGGGVAYAVKRGFLWLVKHTVNRVSVPLARSGHGPFALVRHVGRRSGRTYATPLVVARVPDGFVIELTYGPDVDWYRNITAAGGCVVTYRAVEYQVDRIESCSTADGLAAFGFPRSFVLRLLRRREFRRLHVAEADVYG
jgi:hypothetical protein